MATPHALRVAIVQIAPVVLDRDATLSKIVRYIDEAAGEGAGFVAFGEALVPCYPMWTERTDGARFDASDQKNLHARYLSQALDLEAGDLTPVCDAARRHGIAVSVSVIERPGTRGMSLYCASVFVSARGSIDSVHRKLVPTYEERLSWAPGDGHGLVTHGVSPFTVGTLNCWENWMPLARAALYAAGENLHVAHWPGCERNTRVITPFIAREGRSFCLSVSCLLREQDFPSDVPERDRIVPEKGAVLFDGGSCIAGPDGEWIIEPFINEEGVRIADLDFDAVRRERQNFDPAGHYSRPDVLRLTVDRGRQRAAEFIEDTHE